MLHLYLFLLGLIWIGIAVYQDIKREEIDNWISFSLVPLALAYRMFYSIIYKDYNFILYGLIGLLVFIILGYAFYYGKVFAGGDAKLFMSLGAIIAGYGLFNLIFSFFGFVIIFLSVGSIYGIAFSLIILLKNKKRFPELFIKNLKENKKMFVLILFALLVSLLLVLVNKIFIILSVLIIVFPFLYAYAKSIDVFMIKKIKTKDLREGDWLVEDIQLRKGRIKAKWEGLSLEEIELLRKYKKEVEIKKGIVFAPVFLISFILFFTLWDPSWYLKFLF